MPYVDTPLAHTYYEESGDGEALLLLHGGFCSIEHMRVLGSLLAEGHRVIAPERVGHGRTPDRDGEYSYGGMLAETVAFLDAIGVERVHVVGFSDGGIIGELLARDHPHRVISLVSIAANVTLDGYVPDDYPHVTVPEEARRLVRVDNERLRPEGPEHVEVVLQKVYRMWASEPDYDPQSFAAVSAPVLLMRGEHDAISREHLEMLADVHRCELVEVPGTTHMLVSEKPAEVAASVRRFLDGVRQTA